MSQTHHSPVTHPVDFLDPEKLRASADAFPNQTPPDPAPRQSSNIPPEIVSTSKRFSFSSLPLVRLFIRSSLLAKSQFAPNVKPPTVGVLPPPESITKPKIAVAEIPKADEAVSRSAEISFHTKLDAFPKDVSSPTPSPGTAMSRQEPIPEKVEFLRKAKNEEIDINLIQEEKGVRIKPQVIRIGVFIFFIIEFCILLGITLVMYAKSSTRMVVLADLEGALRIQEVRIAHQKNQLETSMLLMQKASALTIVLDRRQDPLQTFQWFERHMLPAATLKEFSLDPRGEVHTSVVTRDALSAAQQMRIFLDTPDWISTISELKQIKESGVGVREPLFSFSASFTPRSH